MPEREFALNQSLTTKVKTMITFIPSELTAPVWRTIELGAGATIEIAIKRPTLGEQLAALDDSRGESLQAYLLRSRIVDWRGVNDPFGQAVPYSWDHLSTLCMDYPDAIWELLTAVRAVFARGEPDAKNFNSPPLAGGMETTVEPAVLTVSSVSTTTCAGSGGSV